MNFISPATVLTTLFLMGSVAWGILFWLFSRLTVHRLQSNPHTRHRLGSDFLPGWRTLNVAEALTLPRPVLRRLRRGRLSEWFADEQWLARQTNPVDRWLGRACYVLLYVDTLLLFAAWMADR